MRVSGLCDRNGMAYIETPMRELTAENSLKNRCRYGKDRAQGITQTKDLPVWISLIY